MKTIFATLLAALCFLPSARAADTKPVKVYILAGQSNMEGHGFVSAEQKRNEGKGSLEWLVKQPATAAMFKPIVKEMSQDMIQWRERDDVFISYLDRSGPLKAGYGAKPDMIGPELGFGWHLAYVPDGDTRHPGQRSILWGCLETALRGLRTFCDLPEGHRDRRQQHGHLRLLLGASNDSDGAPLC